jgi:hypothetical protein
MVMININHVKLNQVWFIRKLIGNSVHRCFSEELRMNELHGFANPKLKCCIFYSGLKDLKDFPALN